MAHDRPGPTPRPDESILASIERLITAGRELAEAEFAWAKLKGLSLAAIARRGLLFAVIALTSLIVGLTLILVAAVVALTPFTGLLGAALIISAAAFAVTILFGLLARHAIARLISGSRS